jgi:putative methyltransferase (TIGR04325 family)
MRIIRFIKKRLPFLVTLKRSVSRYFSDYGWFGNYASWEEAKKYCTGYDDKLILEKVKNACLKVKNKEAVFERDGVCFYEPAYLYPLLAVLLKIAGENNGELSVIDFGGSLGSAYMQHKAFLLPAVKRLNWYVVEQPHFVACGQQFFEDEHLHFRNTVEEVLAETPVHLLFSSGALPYIEKPYEYIEHWLKKKIKYIFLDKIPLIAQADRINIQKVPPHIYVASYPSWFFNQPNFIQKFTVDYALEAVLEGTPLPNTDAAYFTLFFKIK